MLVPGQQVEVVTGEVALECTVGRAAREKGLIDVWMVGVPVVPIFTEQKRVSGGGREKGWRGVQKVVVGVGFVSVRAEESVHHVCCSAVGDGEEREMRTGLYRISDDSSRKRASGQIIIVPSRSPHISQNRANLIGSNVRWLRLAGWLKLPISETPLVASRESRKSEEIDKHFCCSVVALLRTGQWVQCRPRRLPPAVASEQRKYSNQRRFTPACFISPDPVAVRGYRLLFLDHLFPPLHHRSRFLLHNERPGPLVLSTEPRELCDVSIQDPGQLRVWPHPRHLPRPVEVVHISHRQVLEPCLG